MVILSARLRAGLASLTYAALIIVKVFGTVGEDAINASFGLFAV